MGDEPRLDPDTGVRLVRSLSGAGDISDLRWSPDGQLLAAAGDDGVMIWKASAGSLEHHLAVSGFERYVRSIEWSVDGSILITGDSWKLHSWRVANWTRLATTNTGSMGSLSRSPSGGVFAGCFSDDNLQIRQIETVEQVQIAQVTFGQHWGGLAWSPDGAHIAATFKSGDIALWDGDTRELERKLHASNAPNASLAWRPDSSVLATGSDDGSVYLSSTSRRPSTRTSRWRCIRRNRFLLSSSTTRFSSWSWTPRCCWAGRQNVSRFTTQPPSWCW